MSSMTNTRVHNKFDLLIPAVREKLLLTINDPNADPKSVHEKDIENLKNDDMLIRRFLVACSGDVDNTIKLLHTALKWFKAMDFHDIDPAFFPAELYSMGAVFLYEPDNHGRPTMYIRMKSCLRVPELTETVKHWVAWLLWRMDTSSKDKGWTVVMDFTGSSMANYDMSFAKFFALAMKNYFPGGMQLSIGVDILFIARGLWYVIKEIVPKSVRNLLVLVPKDKLSEHIPIENIPPFLGGTCKTKYCGAGMVPAGSPTCREFAINHLKVPPQAVERIGNSFGPLLQKIHDENQLLENQSQNDCQN